MLEVVVTATALICAIILLRLLLGGRISPRLRYALWVLVLARLLIPVTFWQSPASVLNAVPQEAPLVWGMRAPDMDAAPAGLPAEDTAPKPFDAPKPIDAPTPASRADSPALLEGDSVPSAPAELVSALPAFALGHLLTALWAAGVGLTALCFLVSNLRFYARLRRARVAVAAVASPIPVYRADCLEAPCLAGLFRPCVCAPGRALQDPARLRHILAHELAHRRHGDNWWALLRCLCLCLWWFHPLVWVAAILSRRDCELACDAAAVKVLGEAERIPYGETLVALVALRGGTGDLLMAATAMTAGKQEIKERVIALTRKKIMTKRMLALVLALAALMAVTTFTGAVPRAAADTATALPLRVMSDPALHLDTLDLSRVAIPDFPWGDERGGRKEAEKNIRWMYAYGQQFYALPDGSPWKADDVLVYSTRGSWVTLAVRPVGGLEAVRPLFKGGVPHGTGAYSGYVMMEYHVGGLGEETRADGSTWWVGTRNEPMIVTPVWHRVPPPDPSQVTDALVEQWLSWLPSEISALYYTSEPLTRAQIGAQWAEAYTSKHKTMSADDGTPLWSDDVKVLAMDLQAAQPDADPTVLIYHLRYAFRPVWGLNGKLLGRVLPHYNFGTGDLEGYVIVDAQVTLSKSTRETLVLWTCTDYQYQYGSNYDGGMTLSFPLAVPKAESDRVLPGLSDGAGLSIQYGAGQDETTMRGSIPALWAMEYARQFYQLDSAHPLYSDRVEVTSVSSFYPRQTTASGIDKVLTEFTAGVMLDFYPVNGVDKAAAHLKQDCHVLDGDGTAEHRPHVYTGLVVTLTRGAAADGAVTWTCSEAQISNSSYAKTAPPAYAALSMPIHVAPRAGYRISALDAQAAYVPDDGKNEDIYTRWAVAYAQQFYALPDGNLWKGADVIVRDVSDGWVSLAVKPARGIAPLEDYFPGDVPRGQGDLEGYVFLQYSLTLNRMTAPVLSPDPVWTPVSEAEVQPLWVTSPYIAGSEYWQRRLEDWARALAGSVRVSPSEVSAAAGYAIPVGYADYNAIGLAWAKTYLRSQTSFNTYSRSPVLAEDVTLLGMDLKATYKSGETEQLAFSLRYAFRPMWGLARAQAFFDAAGEMVTPGTGELEGYLIRTLPAVVLSISDSGYWGNEKLDPNAIVPTGSGWTAKA